MSKPEKVDHKRSPAWRVSVSKEVYNQRVDGFSTTCTMYPQFTVYAKAERVARGLVRQLVGDDGSKDNINWEFTIKVEREDEG